MTRPHHKLRNKRHQTATPHSFDLAAEVANASVGLAVIGVTYGAIFYGQLKINIFDYAASTDFVVWSVRNPFPLAAFVLAIGLSRRFVPGRLTRTVLPLGIAAFTAGAFAFSDAARVRSGMGRLFFESPCAIASEGMVAPETRLTPIGSAGDFLIYYRRKDASTHVLLRSRATEVVC